MHYLKPLVIVALYCAALVYTESIEQICNVVSGGLNCNNKITLPTTAETKYCPNKIFEVRTHREKRDLTQCSN